MREQSQDFSRYPPRYRAHSGTFLARLNAKEKPRLRKPTGPYPNTRKGKQTKEKKQNKKTTTKRKEVTSVSHQDTYKTNIYVLNADGTPLMPCHSQRKARKWIKTGKAVVAGQKPYTLQLTYQISEPKLQTITLGIDPGATNIGAHLVDEQGRSLLASDIQTDNKNVTKNMTKRRECRHASRRGERKRRQRRQIRISTKSKKITYMRMLPQCDEPITCKVIRNSKVRFCNRTRPVGWVTPTVRNLIDTHVNLANKFERFLPVAKINFEDNNFDFTRMKIFSEKTWDKIVAPLLGYDSARDFVSAKQDGKCLLCDGDIEEYHHVIWRSRQGADTVANMVGLCCECHEKVHKNTEFEKRLVALVPGQKKVFGRVSILNQAIPFIIAELSEKYDVFITDGRETSRKRKELGLPKSSGSFGHYVDAYCIAIATIDSSVIPKVVTTMGAVSAHYHVIRQFRRHDRARVHYQKQRTYRDASGKIVAKNRHKATGQQDDSLWEYREKFGDAAVSRLSCVPSKRSYKDPSRVLPGAVFVSDDGSRHVLSGQSSGGSVLLSDGERFARSKCRIVRRNEGLVFLS